MSRHAVIVVDLGYGDGGKGAIVDALTERYNAHTVVRYNGGAQAAHTVVTPSGKVHTFAQWGSGTFHEGVRTYLSEYMLVDPLALMNEELYLRSVGIVDAYERMFIDERAFIVTPFARALNRLREYARGDARHGSCGMGIGETVEDAKKEGAAALRVGDMKNEEVLNDKLMRQRERMHTLGKDIISNILLEGSIRDEWDILSAVSEHAVKNTLSGCVSVRARTNIVGRDWVETLFREDGVVVFEGAQGVLIDQKAGFAPHTTWSDTTTRNAKAILREHNWEGEIVTVGVLRAYGVRHGPGPFVSEERMLTELLPDSHNSWNEWQRDFRVGWFDAVVSRYALRVTNGVDMLALTNLDRIAMLPEWSLAIQYQSGLTTTRDIDTPNIQGESLTKWLLSVKPVLETMKNSGDVSEFISLIERELSVPVVVCGLGPSSDKKEWRQEIIAL